MHLVRRSSIAKTIAIAALLLAAMGACFFGLWQGGVVQQAWGWGLGLGQTLDASGQRASQAVARAAQTNRQRADDEAISAQVLDALVASQSDELAALQVETSHAMVTLRGTVSSLPLRDRAVAIANHALGVHGVFSLIQVHADALS
ncbi:BON domain-containing protein [Comamonas piscis]|uniref:BON domain-containing protein n=1 Tax=Comamonas piscis TaxID=1562974 RepID=A0A7G5EIU5_9BURK|nr:BON domain-containing protein [Comamonas piscis]QMV73920.1 BON domain-containing protein [Comamonas piscis]WSO32345.1 BON domain-containing protein [Comamonas piscis]